MDFDDLAPLGMGPNSAAPLATRLVITVKTSHEEAAIQALVAQVLEKDTFSSPFVTNKLCQPISCWTGVVGELLHVLARDRGSRNRVVSLNIHP